MFNIKCLKIQALAASPPGVSNGKRISIKRANRELSFNAAVKCLSGEIPIFQTSHVKSGLHPSVDLASVVTS